jgi:hypothetical protein
MHADEASGEDERLAPELQACQAGDAAISVSFAGAGDASYGTGPLDCVAVNAPSVAFVPKNSSVWTDSGCSVGGRPLYDGTWGVAAPLRFLTATITGTDKYGIP